MMFYNCKRLKKKRFYSKYKKIVEDYLSGKISYTDFLTKCKIEITEENNPYTTYIKWLKLADKNTLSSEKRIYMIIKIVYYFKGDIYFFSSKDFEAFKKFENEFKSCNNK
jgi:hypothetical protein